MVSAKPCLYYFDLPGRAESIRYAATLGKIDFDDVRLTSEEFKEKKMAGEWPMGSVPVWVENGEKYCGSNNIMRMIGMRCGMYDASNSKVAWMIDSAMECIEDNMKNFTAYFFKMIAKEEPGEEQCNQQLAYWTKVCGVIESRMAKHGKKFVAGTDHPTIADLKMIVNFNFLMSDQCPIKDDMKKKCQDIIMKHPITVKWAKETMKMVLEPYMMKMMKSQCVEVTYFGFGNGRADPIIQLLAHAKVQWKKHGLTFEEWGPRKAAGQTAEFGALPIVKLGGQEFDLSQPALRRLAIVYGYYPKDDWKAALRCDQVTDTYGDAFNALSSIFVGQDEPATKMTNALALMEEGKVVHKFFKLVEMTLEHSKGPFVCGAKVTMADCCLTSFIFNHFKNEAGNPDVAKVLAPVLKEKFPKIEEYSKCLEKEFAAHLTTREVKPF